MKVLFIGGTGQISGPCVDAAVAAGHAVTIFNRGARAETVPAGVDAVRGDLNNAASLAAIADRRFDVVCQFIAFSPSDIERDVSLFAGKTAQYVFVSTASGYTKPFRRLPVREDDPFGNPLWDYSAAKVAAEEALRAQTRLPFTIVRPSHTVRTQLPTALGERDLLAKRLLDGRPVILPGDGNSLWTLTRAEDIARPFVGLFGRSEAFGEAFNLTGDAAFIWNAIYVALGSALGASPDIVHVPSDTLVKFRPELSGPLFGDKARSATFDTAKIRALVGDFPCAGDLDTILAAPVRAALARLDAGAETDDGLDRLIDTIAEAQFRVGPAD